MHSYLIVVTNLEGSEYDAHKVADLLANDWTLWGEPYRVTQ